MDLFNFQCIVILELRREERHGQIIRVVSLSLVVQDEVDCSRGTQGQEMALGISEDVRTFILHAHILCCLVSEVLLCSNTMVIVKVRQPLRKAASVPGPN